MPPGTTKKEIQRSPRNFNPRSNKQKNCQYINFFQLKSNLQTSNNVGSSNHPVIINVKALLLSADASRDTRKENPATQPLFSKPCALLLLYKSFFCYYHYFGGGVYIFPTSSGSMFPSFSFRGTHYLTLREANSYFSYKFFKWLLRCVPKLSWVR